MDTMVCPDCGNAEFTQRRSAYIEVTLTATRYSGSIMEDTLSEEILDSDDNEETFTCTDCGLLWDGLEQLITEDEYNREDEE